MNVITLLADYRATRSEQAFGELVRRYTNLVFSVAKRRLGNAALAEEVAQTVFTRLAQSPPHLKHDAELTAWLHRTAIHVAIDVWRSETRRQTREQHAVMMQSTPSPKNEALWDELAPLLDEALDDLQPADRHALLLRFFEHKPMREVGYTLGVSEDAAKMRVSRALDRLRSCLALRGVSCAGSALAALLMERSIEAAPAPLTAHLAGTSFRLVHEAASAPNLWRSLLSISKVKLAGGTALLLVLAAGGISLLRSLTAEPTDPLPPPAATLSPEAGPTLPAPLPARKSGAFLAATAPAPEVERLAFRVLNAETGAGISGAKVHTAYFYPGGRGEPHDTFTDETGTASLPEALDRHERGANVFVVAEGYVPKVVSLSQDDPRREYTMRLDPAASIGGMVVDERDQPLPGVEIRVQRRDEHKHGGENVDFQLCPVRSDAQGRWICRYIPKEYDDVRLILTREDFAVTLPDVPAREANTTNLVLVMSRGCTLLGQVVDAAGRPVPGARVLELNRTSYRQQSVLTDENGRFVLTGTGQCESYTSRPPQRRPDGTLILRGMLPNEELSVVLSVMAEGFAPQSRQIPLPALTNSAAFRLSPGQVFHGRIVDERGQPIPKAVVRTDSDNQGITKFRWTTNTDADGRFRWDSAPAEPTLFWFEAPGYEVQREVLLVPGAVEHRVTLKQQP